MKKKNWVSIIAIALLLSFTLTSCYVGTYGPPPRHHGGGHHGGGHHHGGGGYGGYR